MLFRSKIIYVNPLDDLPEIIVKCDKTIKSNSEKSIKKKSCRRKAIYSLRSSRLSELRTQYRIPTLRGAYDFITPAMGVTFTEFNKIPKSFNYSTNGFTKAEFKQIIEQNNSVRQQLDNFSGNLL